MPFCAAARVAAAVVLTRRSEVGRRRKIADSGCADIPRHPQSLRSPANVMCAGEAHPASLLLARVSCAQARMGQAISEMEGTCHQTWMAELAPERDAIGTWAVDEIGTFGPRRNQLQLRMMEPWQMCDRRAGMPGTTDPSRP